HLVYSDQPLLHSFPTRRSSDLRLKTLLESAWHGSHGRASPESARRRTVSVSTTAGKTTETFIQGDIDPDAKPTRTVGTYRHGRADRKSTRLNSSHEWISYAVF